MNDERVVEEIVTEFLLNTCRPRSTLCLPAIQAALRCVQFTAECHVNDVEPNSTPLPTGSVAEFYIEPMIPHVGDVDVMRHYSDLLAIPAGHPPPTQLPDEFRAYVKVFEIVDSHLPGYVYFQLRYSLTECVDDGKYNADVEFNKNQLYLLHANHTDTNINVHWPAVVEFQPGSVVSADLVNSVRCLMWPPQAATWPTRHRNYGWPDSATVDRVVSNGCDVVPVAHRQCRQDEWMNTHQ